MLNLSIRWSMGEGSLLIDKDTETCLTLVNDETGIGCKAATFKTRGGVKGGDAVLT